MVTDQLCFTQQVVTTVFPLPHVPLTYLESAVCPSGSLSLISFNSVFLTTQVRQALSSSHFTGKETGCCAFAFGLPQHPTDGMETSPRVVLEVVTLMPLDVGALTSSCLTPGGPVHPGGPGHGASVQQPLCAQGPGRSQLPGQRPETGEGVGPGAQQGCVQQVEGHGGAGQGAEDRCSLGGVGRASCLLNAKLGGPGRGRAFSSPPEGWQASHQWATHP